MKKITPLACILLATQLVYSQEAIPVPGGDARGPKGSGSYSVSQVFYTTNTATTGSVSPGVQQPFEFSGITAPTFAGTPSDITVSCSNVPLVAEPTATDNCDGNVDIVLEETSTTNGCVDILTRTWTATEGCGNKTVASQKISINSIDLGVLEFWSFGGFQSLYCFWRSI